MSFFLLIFWVWVVRLRDTSQSLIVFLQPHTQNRKCVCCFSYKLSFWITESFGHGGKPVIWAEAECSVVTWFWMFCAVVSSEDAGDADNAELSAHPPIQSAAETYTSTLWSRAGILQTRHLSASASATSCACGAAQTSDVSLSRLHSCLLSH